MSHDGGQLVVIVEGDLDEDFVAEHVLPKASVVNARGKPRILAVLGEILVSTIPVIVLLDRDFDFELGKAIEHPNVLYTDRYNLEATLLLEPQVFQRLWHQHLRRAHRAQLAWKEGLSICEQVAKCIGDLRFVSMRLDLGLLLDQFPTAHLLDPSSPPAELAVRTAEVVDLTLMRSSQSVWVARRRARKADGFEIRARKFLLREIRRVQAPTDSHSGHDVSRMFNALLVRMRRTGVPSAQELEWQAGHELSTLDTHGVSLVQRMQKRSAELGYAA